MTLLKALLVRFLFCKNCTYGVYEYLLLCLLQINFITGWKNGKNTLFALYIMILFIHVCMWFTCCIFYISYSCTWKFCMQNVQWTVNSKDQRHSNENFTKCYITINITQILKKEFSVDKFRNIGLFHVMFCFNSLPMT